MRMVEDGTPHLMARFTVKHNLQVSRTKKLVTVPPGTMRNAGQLIVNRITLRTRDGLNAKGKQFPSYADGRRPVTLWDTGNMLRALAVVRVSARGFAIGFLTDRAHKLATFHTNGTRVQEFSDISASGLTTVKRRTRGGLPARPFVSVTLAWTKDLVRLIKASMAANR